jgi:hypothetical protein
LDYEFWAADLEFGDNVADEEGHTLAIHGGEDVVWQLGVEQKLHQIWTMHQISHMHHYLQVEELREAKETEEIGEAGELKVAKTCWLLVP